MTKHNLSPQNDELKEFGDSLAKYSRKNTSWLYLLFIIIVLFGIVYLIRYLSVQKPQLRLIEKNLFN